MPSKARTSLRTVAPKGSDDEICSSLSSLSPDEADVFEVVVASPPHKSHELTAVVQPSAILSPALSPLTYCISGTPRNNVLRKVTNLSVDKSSVVGGIVSSTSSSSSISCLSEHLNFTALEKFEGL